MNNIWYVYVKGYEPDALEFKYPNRAQHPPKNEDGTDPEGVILLLYVEGLEDVTGHAPELVLELFREGLNHPFDEEGTGLTLEELVSRFEGLISDEPQPPTSAEVQILKSQGRLIYKLKFKIEGPLNV